MRRFAALTLDERVVVDHVEIAATWFRRAFGLMGRTPLPAGHALYLTPCRCVHTFFMRFALDLIFLDGDGRVVRIARQVRPWRAAAGGRGTVGVVEMTAGWLPANVVHEGDRLQFRTNEAGDL
jgi:uncharacterized membrane protein (UPF0127 family)